MKISITGVNHKTAPVEVRERLNFEAARLPRALQELKRKQGLFEGMILSTCNRVEVALATDEAADAAGLTEEFLSTTQRLEPGTLAPYLYRHDDAEAIRHLFRVAASLDSMVVGEPQILGQLKGAYAAAKAEGMLAGTLEFIVTNAFRVAKRVRTETEIGESAVSVSYAAVELARQIFGNLDKRAVMIVGAGKMSELAARHLRRAGARQVFVTNRTRDRAVEMAELFNGSVVEYDRFKAALSEVDIVITSSGAPHYLIQADDMRRVIEQRRNRPMFLIDIAVPRNVDPAVNDLDNVFLYDIDDLQQVVEGNLRSRGQEAESAEAIIDEEVERTLTRLRARELTPTIVGLQQSLEEIRVGELGRIQGRLSSLTPEQREAVEALTRGLVNKIAHGPITELRRRAGEPDGVISIDTIRRAFRLDT